MKRRGFLRMLAGLAAAPFVPAPFVPAPIRELLTPEVPFADYGRVCDFVVGPSITIDVNECIQGQWAEKWRPADLIYMAPRADE